MRSCIRCVQDLASTARNKQPAVDRATLSRVIDRLDTKGLPGAAAYFRKSASAFLNWAVNTGRLHASPLAGYRREKTTRRQQVAAKRFTIKTEEGIRHFWQATECANIPIQRDYLRFLLITGQRRTETALMCWTDVDLAKGIWEIPLENSKMGVPHTVYLEASSLALLKAQPRFAKHDLVFPGRNLRPMSGWSKIIMPVKEAFGNPALSLHALRRTYRTMLSELGVDEDIAERMIGHQRPALVSAYDKSQMVERRKTTQARYEAPNSGDRRMTEDRQKIPVFIELNDPDNPHYEFMEFANVVIDAADRLPKEHPDRIVLERLFVAFMIATRSVKQQARTAPASKSIGFIPHVALFMP